MKMTSEVRKKQELFTLWICLCIVMIAFAHCTLLHEISKTVFDSLPVGVFELFLRKSGKDG